MGKNKLRVVCLLIALMALALVGCGGGDETPPAGNGSQTAALVPDSVVNSQEADEIAPPDAGPAAVDVPLTESTEAPKTSEPAAVVKEVQTPVSVEKNQTAPPAPAGNGIYSLQLGSYTVGSMAEAKAAELRKLGHPATVEQADVGGQLYHRVFIRGLSDRKSAEKLGEELHASLGLSYLIRRK